jgi:AraC-like DNA-binding protein
MLAWSPILIQKIEIHALGFVLQKLQLNRHHAAEVKSHRHEHAQLILYLSGEGLQTVASRRRRAGPGELFVIPAGTPHGFSLLGRSRPVCLVLDYQLAGAARLRPSHRRLPPDALNELHALLARVPPKGRLNLADYSNILAVIARLLEPQSRRSALPPSATTYDKIRERLGADVPLADVARSAGYHPDHLTRKLKREAGLGLRALRNRIRLASAEAALRTEASVADAAARAGFEDPNYFARWFRQ